MKRMIKLLLTIGCLVLYFGTSNELVKADNAFRTYTQNGYQEFVETQSAYIADKRYSLFNEKRLNKPTDMQFGINDDIFIADSGNKQIIVINKDGTFVRSIQIKEFQHPVGVYVDEKGWLYVADDSAKKVFVLNELDQVVHIFSKPKSISFGQRTPFSPTKVIVDKRENVYVLSEGNNNGIIMLNRNVEGEFLGYFAPNQTSRSLLTSFRKMIFSEEQLEKMLGTTPNSATSLTIDRQGLIYTVTANESSSNSLKKLNMGGMNLLSENQIYFPKSVSVGNIDNIFVIGEDGYIYEYSSEGDLLFMFAGSDDGKQRKGLIGKGVGILVDEQDQIFTLDEKKNEIQVFKPTEFTNKLHQVLNLYQNGRYKESKPLWKQILKINSQFDFANLGLGQAYYQEGKYKLAATSFKKAKYKAGFSDAFWEIRNTWIRNNILTVGLVIVLLMILGHFIKKRKLAHNSKKIQHNKRMRKNVILKSLAYASYFWIHPLDGCYGIKKEKRANTIASGILLVLAICIYLLNKYETGFIFNYTRSGEFSVMVDVAKVLIIGFSFVSATYLICTISDGTAKFTQLLHGMIYALTPYIILKPFVILVSNALTLNEIFVLKFSNLIIYVWIIILLFIVIKELNDYSVSETVKAILLSFFTIFVAAVAIFILYSLFQQMISFVTSLFGEVVHRIGSN